MKSEYRNTVDRISIVDRKIKGELMSIDLQIKSKELLESIANSVHERDPKSQNPLFFSYAEIELVEKWLQEFCMESKEDCVCLESQ